MSVKKVLMVGAGIAGMSAALCLRKLDIDVDMIDADPEWRVYGAGITITGVTLRAFRELGILDEIGRHGALMVGHIFFRYDGLHLKDVEEPPIEPGLPAVGGIMRPVLHRLLSDRVRASGSRVRLGVRVESISEGPGGVGVVFSDGSEGMYDLVVVADGIYSATRAMLFPDAVEPRYTGQGSWRILAARPPGMVRGHFYVGHENMAGIVAVSDTQVYAFVLNPDPLRRRIEPKDHPAEVKRLLADFGGDMAVIRDQADDPARIVYRPLEAALQPTPWNRGRCVLIGDAAHATTPHLACGAGAAVEDALVLAEELRRPGRAVEEALAAFGERRFDRCRTIVESSVAIGALQLSHGSGDDIGRSMAQAMHKLAAPY